MKRLAVFLFLILLGMCAHAQQNYFSKRFDYNGSHGEGGTSILPTDSGCLVLFETTNSSGAGLLQTGMLFLGDTGNVQVSRLYSVANDFFFLAVLAL